MGKAAKSVLQASLLNRYAFAIAKVKKTYTTSTLIPYLFKDNVHQRILAIKSLGKLGDKHTKVNGKNSGGWLLKIIRRSCKKANCLST